MFPDGVPSGSILISNIAFGAAALGAGHVEICNESDWWFAASETNWLERQLPEGAAVDQLFRARIPFPTLGPNSDRPEIYVAAYADAVYLDLNGTYRTIQGDIPDPPPHIGVVPPWCVYVLGFLVKPAVTY